MRKLILSFILSIILSLAVAAHHEDNSSNLNLPPSLQKAKEYNNQLAFEFLQNISILIAFLAGITTIFSPCLLPLLPAFFAVTFKERTQLTRNLLLFFLGFTPVFIFIGLISTFIGRAITTLLAGYIIDSIIITAGIFLVLLGILTILGHGFSGIITPKKTSKDSLGVFLSGLFFAIGWSACTGPIISGVILMAATLHSYFQSILLMSFYSLGIFVPLLILTFFYDKLKLHDKNFFKGKEFNLVLGGKTFTINTSKLVAGILLIFVGIIFIIFKGTSVLDLNTGLNKYYYSLQNLILANTFISNIVGTLILVIFIIGMYFAIKK